MFKYNEEFDFYGVCNNEFKLNDTVYEAVEDPDDGYRSYLGSIEVKNSDGIFFGMPLARVKAVAVGNHRDLDGWEFVDVTDGHVWLRWVPTVVTRIIHTSCLNIPQRGLNIELATLVKGRKCGYNSMVECRPSKSNVVGSSPIARSVY